MDVIYTPPGWYQDPFAPALLRWWDGLRWTEHLAGHPAYAPAYPSAYPSRYPPAGADPALRWILPVGRSGLAIAAGYLGLFATVLVPAPIALVTGVVALRDLNRHPDKLGRGRAWFGIVMGAAFTVLLVLMLVNAAP